MAEESLNLQRTRYLNAVNTFKELLAMGVVPIVNENDTISVSVSKSTLLERGSTKTQMLRSRKSNSVTMIHFPR